MIQTLEDDQPPLEWRLVFHLCWTKGDALHGSGMSFTRADVLDMTVEEALHYIDELGARRRAEAAALKGRAISPG
jgi:hypothetical protein